MSDRSIDHSASHLNRVAPGRGRSQASKHWGGTGLVLPPIGPYICSSYRDSPFGASILWSAFNSGASSVLALTAAGDRTTLAVDGKQELAVAPADGCSTPLVRVWYSSVEIRQARLESLP